MFVGREWLSGQAIGLRLLAAVAAALLVLLAGFMWPGWRASRWGRRPEILLALVVAMPAWALNRTWMHLPPDRDAGSGRPNVILITLDTVRADHLPSYGYRRDTAPNLSRLAERSTLFLNAIAPSNYTLPSHTSMFTGLYGSAHGNNLEVEGRVLSPSETTLAESLSRAGYTTLAVVANSAFLGKAFGLSRGFQYHDARVCSDPPYLPRNAACWPWVSAEPGYRPAGSIEGETDALLRAVAARSAPFFLFVNFLDAHAPYESPRSFSRMFDGEGNDLDTRAIVEQLSADNNHEHWHVPSSQREHLAARYDGAIAYVDSAVGRLLATLRSLNLYDNTLIIITSDHGEGFGDKGFFLHGNTVYQELIHVPLIVKFPHQTNAGRRPEVVSLNDVFPTILDAASCRSPHRHDGISWFASQPPRRVVLSEGFKAAHVNGNGGTRLTAAISERWKLIAGEGGAVRYVDLVASPDESITIPRLDESVSARLLESISMLARMRPQASPVRPLDREATQRLRALGYLH